MKQSLKHKLFIFVMSLINQLSLLQINFYLEETRQGLKAHDLSLKQALEKKVMKKVYENSTFLTIWWYLIYLKYLFLINRLQ